MLLAVLYCEDDRIGAVAPACDQSPFGNQYWRNFFAGKIDYGSVYETAYVEITDRNLINRLFMIGFDDSVDGRDLAKELEFVRSRKIGRAA